MTKKEQQALLNDLYSFVYDLDSAAFNQIELEESIRYDLARECAYIQGAEFSQDCLLAIFNNHHYKIKGKPKC
jgi:hypothetical protein